MPTNKRGRKELRDEIRLLRASLKVRQAEVEKQRLLVELTEARYDCSAYESDLVDDAVAEAEAEYELRMLVEEENKKLREALRTYGATHTRDCQSTHGTGLACDCGFDALMKEATDAD